MTTKTVLLTGFEPFNKETVNPAWEAVQTLQGWSGEGFAVQVRQLPCVFGEAIRVIEAAMAELKPAVVIAVGQAGGRVDMSVERVAINVDDAPIPDNAQRQLVDQAIVEGGPAAYFSSLPIKAIVGALRAQGVPASVSQTAGTFVCNHVFYGVMHATAGSDVKAGFVHIPYLPAQAAAHPGAASMALDVVVKGLKVVVERTIGSAVDVQVTGGATH
jgi:pyroglutamyl-peptidase